MHNEKQRFAGQEEERERERERRRKLLLRPLKAFQAVPGSWPW